jgi:soluble lytic murein transglycosylase-like protein
VKNIFTIAIVVVAGAACASAADLAVLRNGNSIRNEHHEVVGSVTRLYLSDSSNGYIEIPTDQIERFEKDTSPPPVPANSQPAQQRPVRPQLQPALTRDGLNQVVNGAGERHQIDPDFINSVIRAESGFHQNAVSKKGAQGLMQLMPDTASKLGVSNTFDPNANVEGGTKYLRELLEKYNYDVPKALAAYNAGEKRVDQYHGIPPYQETQAYVARIIRDFNKKKIAQNPALARKMKPGTQHSASTEHRPSSASSPKPKTTAVDTQKRKTTLADSLPKGPQTASK